MKNLKNPQIERALVIGGTGFIGTNLCLKLLDNGTKVIAIDSANPHCGSRPANFDVLSKHSGLKLFKKDVTQFPIDEILSSVDVVFNLAGHIGHQQSVKNPRMDLDANVTAVLSIIEAISRTGSKPVVVHTSTRQVYGKPQYVPVDEKHPVVPIDSNGINKFAGDLHLQLYSQLLDFPCTTLRLTNTYGPRQRIGSSTQGFVGWFFNRIILKQPIEIWGQGTQRRDFNFVSDVVEACIAAAELKDSRGEVFNLSGPIASIREIAETLIDIAGEGRIEFKEFSQLQKALEIGDYFGTSKAFSERTGWKWEIALKSGLQRTLDFYRQNFDDFNS